MSDSPYRPLKVNERELLEKLLEPNFPGRDELRAQLEGVVARALDEEGCLSFQCHSGPPAPVTSPIPTEGKGRDIDGGPVFVMLQVFGGFMRSLIMTKAAPTPLHGLPAAETVDVFAPGSDNPGVDPTPFIPPVGYRGKLP